MVRQSDDIEKDEIDEYFEKKKIIDDRPSDHPEWCTCDTCKWDDIGWFIAPGESIL